uniref:Transmembrane protein n=1 Tax=Phlegmariurus squarrosus TaxID=73615 RepID=H9M831_PHLSQ|nr:hypothetical protein HusqMp23 [Phlegmariurus squarrosus]AEV55738.1 hypothetical protein HusqMp23 [Phlegmariurus squarrosus]
MEGRRKKGLALRPMHRGSAAKAEKGARRLRGQRTKSAFLPYAPLSCVSSLPFFFRVFHASLTKNALRSYRKQPCFAALLKIFFAYDFGHLSRISHRLCVLHGPGQSRDRGSLPWVGSFLAASFSRRRRLSIRSPPLVKRQCHPRQMLFAPSLLCMIWVL